MSDSSSCVYNGVTRKRTRGCQVLLVGLPSSSTSRKELIEELSAFLHRTAEEGGRTVVIVDEAQNLEPMRTEYIHLGYASVKDMQKLLESSKSSV